MAKVGIIGLKDIHVGKLAVGETSYEDIAPLEGAINAKITVNESSNTIFADDVPAVIVNGMEGIEIEIETLGLSTKDKALLLGQTLTDGILEENVNDMAKRPYIGMTFSAELSDGGERLVSIPKIKFTPSEDSFATKTDKVEVTNATLKGTAIPLDSGVYRVMADVVVDSSQWNGSSVESDGKIKVAKAGKEAFLKKIPQSIAEAKTELQKNS